MSEGPTSRGSFDRSGQSPGTLDTGTLGMAIFIAALGMFFAASVAIYLLMRQMHQPWPPPGFPHLPVSLWISTLDIVLTSFLIQGAVFAARRDDQGGIKRDLVATLALGVAFLGLQSYAWYKIWTQVAGPEASSAYLQMFYALTGLHAVHVLGGLVPLAMITRAAYQGIYGPKKNAAIRYTAIYWHFLDVVWCIVFTVISS